jgi:hypothetical protein
MPTRWGSISDTNFLLQPWHQEQRPAKSVPETYRGVLCPKPHMPPQDGSSANDYPLTSPLPATQMPTYKMNSNYGSNL